MRTADYVEWHFQDCQRLCLMGIGDGGEGCLLQKAQSEVYVTRDGFSF